ncbi:MAG TPA: hypothetical protein VFW22_16385 [Pseudolabrys sp.]|nr:hypothetical protein [Pseudolabrys sp.]
MSDTFSLGTALTWLHFVKGEEPVRIYLTEERWRWIMDSANRMYNYGTDVPPMKFFGVPITIDFMGQGDRIVCASGYTHPLGE